MNGGRLGSPTQTARVRLVRACTAAMLVLATLAAAGSSPARGAAGGPTWSRARFDAGNTGFNPYESSLSSANVASLAQDWAAPVTRWASPLMADGVLYAGCDPNAFCAIDSTNGAVRWKTTVGDTVPPQSAVLVGDVLYLGASRPPTMYALSAATGAVLWKTLVSNRSTDFQASVVASDGLVIQGIPGFLLAWDAATGIQRWVVPLDVWGAPAVVNGVVYVQANETAPTLYALRLTTGETLWRSPAANGYAGRPPIVANGLVIVGADQLYTERSGVLSAYRAGGCGAAVCAPVWSYDGGRSPSGPAAAANGILYQGFLDGYYVAVDAATGRPLWKAATDGASAPITPATGPATVANGLMFGYGGDGKIYAWSAGGCGAPVCQPLWKTSIGSGTRAYGDVVVLGGRVYANDDSGVLHAYSARQNPPPPSTPPPVSGPGTPPTPSAGGTINVPADHLSIQRAIDASRPGDVVTVAPGVYHERLDFHGKAVEVRSSGGPEATVIDGDGLSTVVLFESGESRASILRGFTIRHGVEDSGAGIRISRSSPTIVGNVITGNLGIGGNGIDAGGGPAIIGNQVRDNHPIPGSGGGGGGGITLRASEAAEVRGNVIEDNSADSSGGGLAASGEAALTIVDNIIRRNASHDGGGGVSLGGTANVVLVQNLIVDNTAWHRGGGVAVGGSPALVANTMAGNTATDGTAVYVDRPTAEMALRGNVLTGPAGVSTVECNHTYTEAIPAFSDNLVHGGPVVGCGETGWSAADPGFVNPAAGDYRLGRGSPAIDAGGDTTAPRPATDIAGAPRVVDGNGDGTAKVDIGAYEAQPPVPEVQDGDDFHPLPPARILDTRAGAPLGPGGTVDVQVTGRAGVPATGVSAVVLNITVTEPTATSFLTAWPAGVARPLASNLNYAAGATVPNLVVVKVGEGGRVSLYNNAGSAQVIVDVAGWYGAAAGSRYTPLPPSRILDTRAGVGAPATAVGPASTVAVQVTGRGGVPASGVTAVVLNVTATEPTATSFLTAWPTGQARPMSSNLNVVAGQTVPNLVVVMVGDGGRVNLYNHAGTVHLIADVAGWFGDGAGAGFTSVPPTRILDTRTGLGAPASKPGAASVVELQVTGRGGVPPTGVSAVVLNVTVTEPTAGSFLTVWPAGIARPLTSNLNYVTGLTVPNLVVVKVGEGGRVNLYNNAGSAHLIADVAGWYG